jgi:hypothetical protein
MELVFMGDFDGDILAIIGRLAAIITEDRKIAERMISKAAEDREIAERMTRKAAEDREIANRMYSAAADIQQIKGDLLRKVQEKMNEDGGVGSHLVSTGPTDGVQPEVIKRWTVNYGYSGIIPESMRMKPADVAILKGVVVNGCIMRLVNQGVNFYVCYSNIDGKFKSKSVDGGCLDANKSLSTIAVKVAATSSKDFTFTFENGLTVKFDQPDANDYP